MNIEGFSVDWFAQLIAVWWMLISLATGKYLYVGKDYVLIQGR